MAAQAVPVTFTHHQALVSSQGGHTKVGIGQTGRQIVAVRLCGDVVDDTVNRFALQEW